MAERRVSVKFSAEISNFRRSMEEAATAVQKAKKASEDAGKAADKSAEEIQKQALAHHEAAKAAGLQYDNTGQLVTMNGKALSSQQAAAHGLQTFSQEAYLAGRAAVAAGEDSEAAAKASAEAEKKAAEAAKVHREALENVGAVAAVSGAAILAGVGLAVKSYADFDKQMSSVDAATHETAGNMDLLRQAAIDAGADTAFSAVDAARGIEEMAKAGVSTKDILAGGLSGALALAAAGELDVGTAAELASSALTQFNLKGSDLPHVADLLAAGAGKAQGSVEDLGAALNQSGLVAASTGLTIEETTGTLAAFAKAGLTGSDAGTSFKTMLMSLNPNSKEAAKLMDELGIHAYDAQGSFIGMSEYAGVLQGALKKMGDEERNATLKTLFGSDAVRAANILYKQGAAGIQEWEDAVNDAGFAADTAARMQNNLAGDLEKLGGSFDTVLIQSGSGANEVLRGLVQGLEGLVDAVGKVPAPVLAAGTGLAAVVGGAALVGGTLISVIPKIRDTRDALNTLAPAGSRARGALVGVGKAAGGLAALGTATVIIAKLAEADYMSKIDTGMGRVADALADVTTNAPGAAKSLDSIFQDRDGGNLINGVEDLNTAMQRTFNKNSTQEFNDWGEGLVNALSPVEVKGSVKILEDAFGRVDDSLAAMVSDGKADDAAKAFSKIEEAAKIQGATVEELATKFPAYNDALAASEAAAKTAAAEGKNLDGSLTDAGAAAETAAKQSEAIEKALEDVGLAADGSVTDIDKFTQSLFNAGLLSLSASDASIAYQGAIDAMTDSITTNGTSLDINTEQGRANQTAYNNIAKSAMTAMEATAAQTYATQGSAAAQAGLQKGLQGSYDDLIRAAGQLGITGDAADTMARKALGIPKEIPIKSWVHDQASATLEGIKGKADAVDNRQVNLYVNTHETTFQKVVRQLSGDTSAPVGAGTVLRATGGRVPGLADGGRLPTTGPGTEVTDGFLALDSLGMPTFRGDRGEWVINGMSSERYDRELAAINAGTFPKLPGYANGREYSAQSLGYAPYRSEAPAARSGMHIDKVEINEQSDPRATFAEFARRTRSLGV